MTTSNPSVARVHLETGESVAATVANLAELGAFLHMQAPVTFGAILTVDIADRRLAAEVLYVCPAPRGVVVAWVADADDRAALLAIRDQVPVLPTPAPASSAERVAAMPPPSCSGSVSEVSVPR